MDRDERKLDVFLTFHRSSLLISDMKIFLPFTINLDPYIKKKIKEEQQSLEDDSVQAFYKPIHPWNVLTGLNEHWSSRSTPTSRIPRLHKPMASQIPLVTPPVPSWAVQPHFDWQFPQWQPPPMEPLPKPISATTNFPVRFASIFLMVCPSYIIHAL